MLSGHTLPIGLSGLLFKGFSNKTLGFPKVREGGLTEIDYSYPTHYGRRDYLASGYLVE